MHSHGLQGPMAMSVSFSSLAISRFTHQILKCFNIFLKTDAKTPPLFSVAFPNSILKDNERVFISVLLLFFLGHKFTKTIFATILATRNSNNIWPSQIPS